MGVQYDTGTLHSLHNSYKVIQACVCIPTIKPVKKNARAPAPAESMVRASAE